MDNNKMYSNLTVSASPHMVTGLDTRKTMMTVLMAMVPSFLVSIYVFGPRVIALTAVCVIASMLFEHLFCKGMKKESTVNDLSSAVTGALIAFNVPANFPLWMAVIGCFVAIVIVKELFGGIGRNFANPAITARIVLFVSFATQMTSWPLARGVQGATADATTGPTPLGLIAEGNFDGMPSNKDMFLGLVGGSMGEVSALALIIGGIFLIWKKIISPIIPASFIGTVFVIALIYYGANPVAGHSALDMAIFHICAGGVMLGAIFMATDYTTSPIMPLGKLIMGIGCGFFTMVIRLWAAYPEGVSFSILLMNILTPLIDELCVKVTYGGAKNNGK